MAQPHLDRRLKISNGLQAFQATDHRLAASKRLAELKQENAEGSSQRIGRRSPTVAHIDLAAIADSPS